MKKMVQTVWDFYRANGRNLPWRPPAVKHRREARNRKTPSKKQNSRQNQKPLPKQWHYKILVSEIMLQQTQADRVIPKYTAWLRQFPTMESVARASLSEILSAWQGLGYNSRALRLQKCCAAVAEKYAGKLPKTPAELVALPGIGPYTAGALLAFVYNTPHPIIETNIRTVIIHHFFKNKQNVTDAEIFKKVEQTLDANNPREWYYALMDYGSYLKKAHGNNTRQSKHYTKQSPFKGSNRELRSAILKQILKHGRQTLASLTKYTDKDKIEIKRNLDAMVAEGLLEQSKGSYMVRG